MQLVVCLVIRNRKLHLKTGWVNILVNPVDFFKSQFLFLNKDEFLYLIKSCLIVKIKSKVPVTLIV